MERIKQALERARQERQHSDLDYADQEKFRNPTAEPVRTTNFAPTRKFEMTSEELRDNRIISVSDTDPSASQYRLIRSQIQQRFPMGNSHTIGITSANSGAGKTLTSINLAICMTAEIRSEVLLIDSDLRRPFLHQYVGAEQGIGLVDVLHGKAAVAEALGELGLSGLTLLLGGAPTIRASELLNSPNMISLMEGLKKENFRITLFLICLPF